MDDDPHGPMRGIVLAIPVSIVLWIVIITVSVKACEVLG